MTLTDGDSNNSLSWKTNSKVDFYMPFNIDEVVFPAGTPFQLTLEIGQTFSITLPEMTVRAGQTVVITPTATAVNSDSVINLTPQTRNAAGTIEFDIGGDASPGEYSLVVELKLVYAATMDVIFSASTPAVAMTVVENDPAVTDTGIVEVELILKDISANHNATTDIRVGEESHTILSGRQFTFKMPQIFEQHEVNFRTFTAKNQDSLNLLASNSPVYNLNLQEEEGDGVNYVIPKNSDELESEVFTLTSSVTDQSLLELAELEGTFTIRAADNSLTFRNWATDKEVWIYRFVSGVTSGQSGHIHAGRGDSVTFEFSLNDVVIGPYEQLVITPKMREDDVANYVHFSPATRTYRPTSFGEQPTDPFSFEATIDVFSLPDGSRLKNVELELQLSSDTGGSNEGLSSEIRSLEYRLPNYFLFM